MNLVVLPQTKHTKQRIENLRNSAQKIIKHGEGIIELVFPGKKTTVEIIPMSHAEWSEAFRKYGRYQSYYVWFLGKN